MGTNYTLYTCQPVGETDKLTVKLDGKVLEEGVDYELINDVVEYDKWDQDNKLEWTVQFIGKYSGQKKVCDLTVKSRLSRTYEYKGVKFTYALSGDKAVITGLAVTVPYIGDVEEEILADGQRTEEESAKLEALGEEHQKLVNSAVYTAAWDGKTITIPEEIKVGETIYKVEGVSDIAFCNNNTVQNATGGIYAEKFNLFSTATKIVVEPGLEYIGNSAFSAAEETLTELELGEGLATIGCSKFSSTGVTRVVFPSTLQNMGADMFVGGSGSGTKSTEVYFMGTKVDQSSFSGSTPWMVKSGSTLWGWDTGDNDALWMVENCVIRGISCFSGFEPFAVLGDSYDYAYGWNEETQRCDATVTYDGNVDAVSATAVNYGDRIEVSFEFDYSWVNETTRELTADDFTVTYLDAEGNEVAAEDLQGNAAYTAVLTGNEVTCFGTAEVEFTTDGYDISDATVTFDAPTAAPVYTGTAQMTDVRAFVQMLAAVEGEEGTWLEQGEDFVIAYMDAEGNIVDEAVGAGEYKVVAVGAGLYGATPCLRTRSPSPRPR